MSQPKWVGEINAAFAAIDERAKHEATNQMRKAMAAIMRGDYAQRNHHCDEAKRVWPVAWQAKKVAAHRIGAKYGFSEEFIDQVISDVEAMRKAH